MNAAPCPAPRVRQTTTLHRLNPSLYLMLSLLALPPLFGQESFSYDIPGSELLIRELEFIDQPLGAIIISLARASGMEVLPEPGIQGRGTYRFTEITALNALLCIIQDHGLYLYPRDGLWRIGPARVDRNSEGLIRIQARNCPYSRLIRLLEETQNIPIRYTSLPAGSTDFVMQHYSLQHLLEALLSSEEGYRVEDRGSYWFISHSGDREAFPSHPGFEISKDGALYTLRGRNLLLGDVLGKLFELEEQDMLFYASADRRIEEISVHDRQFREVLDILSEYCDVHFSRYLGTWAVFPGREALTPLMSVEYTPRHRSAEELAELVSIMEAPDAILVPDVSGGCLLVRGKEAECRDLLELLAELDREDPYTLISFVCRYPDQSTFLALLPPKFASRVFPSRDGSGLYFARVLPGEDEELHIHVENMEGRVIRRLYRPHSLSAAEIAGNPPPGLVRSSLQTSADPDCLYFSGPPGEYTLFLEEMADLDPPVTQLQYHLLILQYQENSRIASGLQLGAEAASLSQNERMSAGLGQVTGLNFDIISALGLAFAVDLELDMSSSRARVLADSILIGQSGARLHFSNSSTYRYRDAPAQSADQTDLGSTREIVTGLFIELTGTMASQNELALDLVLEISRRGTETGNRDVPPATSERKFRSSFRTTVGEALMVTGLALDEEASGATGLLPFGSHSRVEERSELAVFLVAQRISGSEHLPAEIPSPGDLLREFCLDRGGLEP